MGRGWYRRRHVDRDFCGHPGANPGGRFTLHILRGRCAARPDRSPFLADEAAALRGEAIGDGIRQARGGAYPGYREVPEPRGLCSKWSAHAQDRITLAYQSSQ